MVSDAHDAFAVKISPSLAEALPRLADEQLTRIVLLLETPEGVRSPSGGRNGRRRASDADSVRAALRPALASIDETLATHGGSRLSDDVDALGSVSVDATPAAVTALSSLSGVRAILVDQPLRGVTNTH